MPLFFLFRVIVMYGFGGGFVTGVLDSLHDGCLGGMWCMMRTIPNHHPFSFQVQ